MSSVKDIILKPITSADARRIVRDIHYSGKVDTRSSVHFGVFLDGVCGGAMQFGASINKHASRNLVAGAGWNDWLELHRMALADWLPRNSESRAIACAMRLLRKHYRHLRWIISYADATQCGDGAIYRAAGFILTDIKSNSAMYRMPDGEVVASIVFNPGFGGQNSQGPNNIKARYGKTGSEASTSFLKRIGAEKLPGFQLRYVYFLDPGARPLLTVPEIPYSEIKRRGASMYRGERVRSETSDTPANHAGEGGATPTRTLSGVQHG